MRKLFVGLTVMVWLVATDASAQQPVTTVSGSTTASTVADAADVTQGAKADARSTATDTTSITLMQVFKEISFMEQNPASRAVTNAGTFAVQATQTTSPWIVAGGGTAGTAASGVVTVQGIASMTKLLVTPDSVALPANQSVNVAQINAATPLMGAGNTGTGSLRVTIATDQAQLTNKLLVTPDANSAVNAAQWNGATSLAGIGLSGTGSPRVTESSDNPVLGNALSTTPLTVNNAASVLTSWYCYNPNTVVEYLQIFDSASVSLGSTTPKWSPGIPALQAAGLPVHLNFTNSIKVATTTTATGSTAPATALDCNFAYE